MGKVFQILGWSIVIFFSLCLVAIALSYFTFDLNFHFLKSKQDMLDNRVWLGAFYVHLFFGVTAILSGLPLFFGKLISYTSKQHKALGKTYVISILLLTGPTGFYLAFFAEGGSWASIGFMMMSLAWMWPTYLAFRYAVKKDFVAHNKWMIRSMAMTLSGVTLRLFTPIGSYVLGFDEQTNFVITAYAPWLFNIMIGEVILLASKKQIKTNELVIQRT